MKYMDGMGKESCQSPYVKGWSKGWSTITETKRVGNYLGSMKPLSEADFFIPKGWQTNIAFAVFLLDVFFFKNQKWLWL